MSQCVEGAGKVGTLNPPHFKVQEKVHRESPAQGPSGFKSSP